MNEQPERLLYRAEEVSELIGFSRAKTYELIAAGTIPSIKIGTSVRVPAGALKAWIQRTLQEQHPAAESKA